MKKKSKGLSFYQPPKKVTPSIFTEIFACLVWMVIAAFIAAVLVYFYGMRTYMVGSSMEPLLYNGQEVLVDRFAYVIGVPKKGDVVVFFPRGNEKSHYYIKRVVAGPGDNVCIREGKLYVNGELSPWISVAIEDAGVAENLLTMQNGQYFCIGENPYDGEDSRHANIGPVGKKDIIGKAWFHYAYGEEKIGFIR